MVMGWSVTGVDCEGSYEVLDRVVAAVEDGEQKADLVLNAGGFGIERGGLLPGGHCGGDVSSGARRGGLGFQIAERGLRVKGGRKKES
jgi:hypothetical protein